MLIYEQKAAGGMAPTEEKGRNPEKAFFSKRGDCNITGWEAVELLRLFALCIKIARCVMLCGTG